MESDDVKFIYLVTRSVNIGKKMKECKRQRWGLGPFLYPKIKIKKKQENHHRAPAGCKNMTRTRVDQKSAAAEIPGNRLVLKASREEDFSHL
jgi:hypothetical protein